ncbi:arginine--tRNA ligase [Candidatus Bathyarchaeota archaeon]|nr:arginine--tRNA ligase [Candidatus Bathyarchaeota archaeon]
MSAVSALYRVDLTEAMLQEPPSLEFGQLASSVSFELSKTLKADPIHVARGICERIDPARFELIERVEPAGSGYVNFHLDFKKAANEILTDAVSERELYGLELTKEPKRIVVEHTSANPSGPLHLGHARNTILGDTLARLLRDRGHKVQTRFYVDDVGKQVAMLAYGYSLLARPKPVGKPDQWLGLLYACVNCAVQIETLKAEISHLGGTGDPENRGPDLKKELDDWTLVARELESIDSALFHMTLEAVQSRAESMKEVEHLVMQYEKGDKKTREVVRTVVDLSLEGVQQTLKEMGITFDEWDWESELVWSGEVQESMKKLSSTPFAILDGASITLDVDAIARSYGLDKTLGFAEGYELPKLTLVRSDGTTLYVARDIAYSIRKFLNADTVINVIGSEQRLAQLQLKLALYALGAKQVAENLVHYAYGIVELPGVKMSKRRARYISLDEIISQAVSRVQEKISTRGDSLSEEERAQIGRTVGLAAIRYAMLSTSSTKTITFTWDRVLSLERNSAPFINYAYTRTRGILAKAGEVQEEPDFAVLTDPLEHFLIMQIGKFPTIFAEAADNLKPEQVAAYANMLAEKFHEYYERVNVLRADTPALRAARLMLVRALRVVLANATHVLGIELTEKM